MEIIILWAKIIGIIIAWEIWKYLGWQFACWLVEKQVEQYERDKRK